jgi:hypothetical protein
MSTWVVDEEGKVEKLTVTEEEEPFPENFVTHARSGVYSDFTLPDIGDVDVNNTEELMKRMETKIAELYVVPQPESTDG